MPIKKNTKVRALDPAAGERALARIEPLLRAMKRDDLTMMTVDAQAAAIAALALVDVAREPSRLAKLSRLPNDIFPSDTVEQLELAAWATWYAHVKLRTESAAATGAKVDAATYEASGQHLTKLLKLLEYHVGDLPDVATELADIRSGTGYQDRATDLVRTAALFDRHRDALKDDRRLYEPDASKVARAYAETIVQSLRADLGKTAAEWSDLRARAWSRMSTLYTELRLAGEFVFRDAPEHRDLFVPMRQVVAPQNGSRKANDQAVAEGAPADGTGVE